MFYNYFGSKTHFMHAQNNFRTTHKNVIHQMNDNIKHANLTVKQSNDNCFSSIYSFSIVLSESLYFISISYYTLDLD